MQSVLDRCLNPCLQMLTFLGNMREDVFPDKTLPKPDVWMKVPMLGTDRILQNLRKACRLSLPFATASPRRDIPLECCLNISQSEWNYPGKEYRKRVKLDTSGGASLVFDRSKGL